MAWTVGELMEALSDYGDHLPVVCLLAEGKEEDTRLDLTGLDSQSGAGFTELSVVLELEIP